MGSGHVLMATIEESAEQAPPLNYGPFILMHGEECFQGLIFGVAMVIAPIFR
jgi:hypothetical protein